MHKFMEITAKDNALVKLVCSLQGSAKARREKGLFVLEGLRICRDAFENSIKFTHIIVTRTALEKFGEEIKRFSLAANQMVLVPDALIKKMSDTDTPQGILAVAEMPKINSKPNKSGRYIGLERVADPSNLGAVARTAEALGIDGIVLTNDGCDPYSPKALRASMGTLLRMPLYICEDITLFADNIGLRKIACVVNSDAKKITEITPANGDIFLIGNEANGLSDKTKEAADIKITIPMSGRAESLNAAAAASIVMWEMTRGITDER